MTPRERRAAWWLLVLFAALLVAEVPGSYLLEPDEARYAEIPREMLATGDWLVPRLNYVDYFEKPPLLYWANAASLRAFGHDAFAARLPTRLAALGVAAVILFVLRNLVGTDAALLGALAFLSCPLGFALGRTNTTDMLLTFFLTLTAAAIARFLDARERGSPGRGWAALTGLSCGLAVLTKGLIGLVLPGGALLFWCLLQRRWRRIPELLVSWGTPLCLAVTVPYFVAVERAAPGFSDFFWVHEHFARYATTEASRPGPPYYFLGVFLAGFLPWTLGLVPVLKRFGRKAEAREADATEIWLGLYAAFVLVFFSLSHSKLPPYVLPMLPAAAVLLGRSIARPGGGGRASQLAHAVFWTAAAAALFVPRARADVVRDGLLPLAAAAVAVAAALAWMGWRRARASRASGWIMAAASWAALYAALVAGFPRVAPDQSAHALATAAGEAAGSRAEIVCYRTYLQGFPWTLERRIRIYGWRGELEFGSLRGDQKAWFPGREDFFPAWDSGRPLVALLRRRDLRDFAGHRRFAEVAENRKYVVVRNY